MFKYLFLEEIRAMKALLKNYLLVVLGILSVIVVGMSMIWDKLMLVRMVINSNISYAILALILIQFKFVFMNDKSGIRIKPALFHYSFNSKRFTDVRKYMTSKMLIKDLIISALISLVIGGTVGTVIKHIAFFSAYLISTSSVRWLRYNHFKLKYCIPIFVLASGFVWLLTIPRWYIMLLMEIIICFFVFFLALKIRPDWGKYNDEIIWIEKIDSAGRHMRIAEMTYITNANLAKEKRIIKLSSFRLSQKNAIMSKAVIESLRSFKRMIILYVLMISAVVALIKVPYITEKIFFGHHYIAIMVSSYIYSGICINMIRTFCDSYIVLMEKHKKGFFVPYSRKRIMTEYLKLCAFSTTAIGIIVGLLSTIGALKIILSIILVNAFAVLVFVAMKNKYVLKNKNLFFY